MSSLQSGSSLKANIQMQVVEFLKTSSYSLNVVNRYKESIVHISAANDCTDILKCILEKHDKTCLERKNSFGWTPLMQAVRNENIEMVKFLLRSGVDVNDFSFLGMSVLSLACAISIEMFDLLYNNCPSALEYASHDDINPLCIAALKNDRVLFFKLIHLGLDVNKANAFTHIMMKQSNIVDIVALAKTHLNSEDYWGDLSGIEELLNERDGNDVDFFARVIGNLQLNADNFKENLFVPTILTENVDNRCRFQSPALISPTLSYFNKNILPVSPNTRVINDNPTTITKLKPNVEVITNSVTPSNRNQSSLSTIEEFTLSPQILQRCQNKRPPDLIIRSLSNDSDTTLSFTPQFSPIKTPNLPQDINEDNVFDETTPTPPKYMTPPRGIITDPKVTKLIILLQRFGLNRHIPIFIEQEVDFDLFLTLTDQDLIEIGIPKKSERLILLSVINECKGIKTYNVL